MQYGIMVGILGQEKDIRGKNEGNMNELWTLVNINVSVLVQ